MFVEGCQEFDAGWAVVNLVADPPEKVGVVTQAMPPIEDESSDGPSEQALKNRIILPAT